MPQVPVYESRLRDQGLPDVNRGPQVSPQDFGSDIAQGLSVASRVVANQAFKEIEEGDRVAVTAAETQLSSWMNDRLFNPDTGILNRKGKDAFNLPATFGPEYDKKAQEIAATLSGPRQARAFEAIRGRRQVDFDETLNRHESAQRMEYYDSESSAAIEDSVRSAGNLFNDPRKIASELKRQEQVINDQARRNGWSEEERTHAIENYKSKTHVEVIDRMLAMKEKTMAKVYYTSVKKQLLGDDATRIERALHTTDESDRSQLRDELRDVEAAARLGVPINSTPSRERLVEAFGEYEGNKFYKQAQAFVAVSEDVRALNDLPASELAETVMNYEPQGVRGAAEQTERLNIVSAAAKQILTTREKDAAAYVIATNPEVERAWTAMTEGQDPEASNDYFRLMQSEQNRLQIQKQNVLPDAYANQLVQRMTNPGDNETLYALANHEAEVWGDHWPQVQAQLASKLPDSVAIISSGIPPQAGIALSKMANLTNTQLRQLVPNGSTWSDLQTGVMDTFEQLLRTFPADAGGARTRGALFDSGIRLALSHTQTGMDLDDAIELAYKELSTDMYEFVEFRSVPYRIPRGIDTEMVEDGARAFIENFQAPLGMDLSGAYSGMLDEELRPLISEYIQENGYWITNPKETGLRLFVDGAPVTTPEGMVEYTWMDLAAEGQRKDTEQREEARRQFEEARKAGRVK
jgi:hypothetical protein